MKVGIIGAGPGGLAAGMMLANQGFDVTVYERASRVGGLEGIFEECGLKLGLIKLLIKFSDMSVYLIPTTEYNKPKQLLCCNHYKGADNTWVKRN